VAPIVFPFLMPITKGAVTGRVVAERQRGAEHILLRLRPVQRVVGHRVRAVAIGGRQLIPDSVVGEGAAVGDAAVGVDPRLAGLPASGTATGVTGQR
jgi:flavin-dependent dehydrogenase